MKPSKPGEVGQMRRRSGTSMKRMMNEETLLCEVAGQLDALPRHVSGSAEEGRLTELLWRR